MDIFLYINNTKSLEFKMMKLCNQAQEFVEEYRWLAKINRKWWVILQGLFHPLSIQIINKYMDYEGFRKHIRAYTCHKYKHNGNLNVIFNEDEKLFYRSYNIVYGNLNSVDCREISNMFPIQLLTYKDYDIIDEFSLMDPKFLYYRIKFYKDRMTFRQTMKQVAEDWLVYIKRYDPYYEYEHFHGSYWNNNHLYEQLYKNKNEINRHELFIKVWLNKIEEIKGLIFSLERIENIITYMTDWYKTFWGIRDETSIFSWFNIMYDIQYWHSSYERRNIQDMLINEFQITDFEVLNEMLKIPPRFFVIVMKYLEKVEPTFNIYNFIAEQWNFMLFIMKERKRTNCHEEYNSRHLCKDNILTTKNYSYSYYDKSNEFITYINIPDTTKYMHLYAFI